jgi:hypothetical protein
LAYAEVPFCFGFEAPPQRSYNERFGTDDESSSCVFVLATSQEEALNWGREVAEAFVQHIFQAECQSTPPPSWKSDGYAHWLETPSDEAYGWAERAGAPAVRLGEFPDFRML